MKAEGADELRLVVLRGAVAVHECRLDSWEVEQLLHLPMLSWWGIVASHGRALTADQEKRLRYLVDLHSIGMSLFGEASLLAVWLRMPDLELGAQPLRMALEEERGLLACRALLASRLRLHQESEPAW